MGYKNIMFSDSAKIIELNGYCWVGKNSQGMFDHSLSLQSPQMVKSTLQTSLRSILIMRHKSSQKLRLENQITDEGKENFEQILKIQFIGDDYFIKNVRKQEKDNQSENFMYLKAPNSYQNNLLLKEGSIIKLGKATLEVAHLNIDKKSYLKRKTFYDENIKKIQCKVQESVISENFFSSTTGNSIIEELPQCRYCFSSEFRKSNPLMNICKCDGSSKFVHLHCINEWVLRKANYKQNKQNGIFSAQKNGLKCQICHENFEIQQILPCFVKQKIMSYIVLQYSDGKDQEGNKIFIVDVQKNKQISLGRSLECDIVFEDLSISRKHCSLLFDNYTGNVFLVDENSKFGTLLKYSGIKIDKNIQIQKGRTKIFARVREKKLGIHKFMNKFFC